MASPVVIMLPLVALVVQVAGGHLAVQGLPVKALPVTCKVQALPRWVVAVVVLLRPVRPVQLVVTVVTV